MAAITLNSNLAALNAQRRLGESTSRLTSTFGRLSSGLRITRPGDDAAGLAIAAGLNVDARVYAQAVRNLNDGISYFSIADGASNELANILVRLKELSEQSANGTLSAAQRQPLNREAAALINEYNRIRATTSFNGESIFNATGDLGLQCGYSDGTLVIGLGQDDTEEISRVSVDSSGNQGDNFCTTRDDDRRREVRFVLFASHESGGRRYEWNGRCVWTLLANLHPTLTRLGVSFVSLGVVSDDT